MSIRNDKLVQVCASCLTASCWYGTCMCNAARSADLVTKTAGELNKLKLEHPDFWSDKKFLEVYGISTPTFPAPRPVTAQD